MPRAESRHGKGWCNDDDFGKGCVSEGTGRWPGPARKSPQGGKLIAKIIDILEDVGFAVEDLEVEVEALTDEVESVAEDLSDVGDHGL